MGQVQQQALRAPLGSRRIDHVADLGFLITFDSKGGNIIALTESYKMFVPGSESCCTFFSLGVRMSKPCAMVGECHTHDTQFTQ